MLGGSGWFGFVAPVGTPAAVVRRFNEDVNHSPESTDVIQRLRKSYAFAEGGYPDDFGKFLADECARGMKSVQCCEIDVANKNEGFFVESRRKAQQ